MFVLLSIVSLFLPNSIFSTFGMIVSFVACGFSIVQGILFIDFVISWNDAWVVLDNRAFPGNEVGNWKKGLLGAAIAFLIVAIGLVWHIAATYPDGGALSVTITALVVSLLLLVANIAFFANEAGLLPSMAVVAFAQWLAWQAVAAGFPGEGGPPAWLALSLGVVSLLELAYFGLWTGVGSSGGEGGGGGGGVIELSRQRARAGDEESSEGGTSGATSTSGGEDGGSVGGWEFGEQCAAHTVAAAYVASTLAPADGWGIFSARVAALVLCLTAYGWVLVGPTVCKNRNF